MWLRVHGVVLGGFGERLLCPWEMVVVIDMTSLFSTNKFCGSNSICSAECQSSRNFKNITDCADNSVLDGPSKCGSGSFQNCGEAAVACVVGNSTAKDPLTVKFGTMWRMMANK